MRLPSRVPLFVLALIVASSAFAQVERWEYAFLTITGNQMIYEHRSLRLSSQELGMRQFIDELFDKAPGFGASRPADWTRNAGQGEMLVLSILGYTGWEIASTVLLDNDRIHFLKRRL